MKRCIPYDVVCSQSKKSKINDDDFINFDEEQYDTSLYIMRDEYEKSIYRAGNNEIHFNAPVNGNTITRIKKLISLIIEENKSKLVKYGDDKSVPSDRENDPEFVITYIVNSPGGSVHEILNFVDYINFLRNTFHNLKFTSIITGMVASAGTIMCVVADKRKMTRFAFAMIHELSTGLGRTQYTHVLTYADHIQELHKALVTIYQESRGIDPDDYHQKYILENLLLRETWLSANEYKELNFVHEIISCK